MPKHEDRSRILKTAGRLHWDGLLFLLAASMTLFARFRNPTLLLASYQDDFYYYLKIAQNLAQTGNSTFNGLNLTNGYHPLWMAVLTLLAKLFHGTTFFVVLQLLSLAAAMLTWSLLRRTLRLITADSIARPAALVLALLAVLLIRYGMEVTLVLPLGAWLLYRLVRDGAPATLRQAATLGLLAAALVLSRLDAAILVLLVCLVVVPSADRQPQPLARAALFFACLAVPIACYLLLNWHFFHLWTPASGLAKQMRTSHVPAARAYETLQPLDRQRLLLIVPQCLLLLVGTFWPSRSQPRLRGRVFRMFTIFPTVHWLTLSVLSDWPTWPWYTYSLTLGCAGAFGLMLQTGKATSRPTLPVRLPLYGYAAVLCTYVAGYAVLGPDSVSLTTSSQQVARWMDAHPGVYLMGDQSGTTGYLSHQPIVQTEGLVMDRAFLQTMRDRTPLGEVARQYHAQYYVVVGGYEWPPCLVVLEPGNAGPSSPTMDGRICHAPLATYYRGNMPVRIFETAWIGPQPRGR